MRNVTTLPISEVTLFRMDILNPEADGRISPHSIYDAVKRLLRNRPSLLDNCASQVIYRL
jgi:hypothetical protein